jgi:dTDP-4-amino-4,6-dideoxygalactose transaminase
MTYKIPLFNLNFDEQEVNAAISTIRSTWISSGPQTELLERTFAEKMNVKFAVALSNCTVALHLANLLVDIKHGDEVIVPSLTFVATVNAVKYTGAIPVFADITSVSNPTISVVDIEQKITSKTKAIIAMHYAGFPCDMNAIMKLAEQKGIKVIEDACHGPFSMYDHRYLGSIGEVGCFSFFSNKNISTGEGGILVTNSESLYKRAKLLRSHGMTSSSYDRSKGHTTEYDVVALGYNYRIDDIRSSIALAQLKKLDEDYRKRELIRKTYLENLKSEDRISISFAECNYQKVSNYIFTIALLNSDKDKRDSVRNFLGQEGIQTSVHYPAAHRFNIYRDNSVSLPNTEYYTDNTITLPMYGNLTTEEVQFICRTLKKAIDSLL